MFTMPFSFSRALSFGAVNHYRFGDPSKLIVGDAPTDMAGWIDTQGNDNLAQLTPADRPVYDPIAGAAVFDGSDYLEGLPTQSSDFTYIMKVKSTSSINQVLLGSSVEPLVFLALINTSKINVRVLGEAANIFSIGAYDGQDLIIAITRAGNDIEIYQNSSNIGSVTTAGGSFLVDRISSASLEFIGTMDDVLTYNKPLTASEIAAVIAGL